MLFKKFCTGLITWLFVFENKRFALDDRIHALACFNKNLKIRLSQMIINKKKFKGILRKRRYSKRWVSKWLSQKEEIQKDSHKRRDSSEYQGFTQLKISAHRWK